MKDNKEVVFMDVDQYQLILDNAQVGWWKADFEERCYICSDYLISLLELDGPKTVSYTHLTLPTILRV